MSTPVRPRPALQCTCRQAEVMAARSVGGWGMNRGHDDIRPIAWPLQPGATPGHRNKSGQAAIVLGMSPRSLTARAPGSRSATSRKRSRICSEGQVPSGKYIS